MIEESWDAIARGENVKAEKLFEEAENKLGQLSIEQLIIKGEIKFRLKKRHECLVCFQDAWKRLENSKKMEFNTKKYFQNYIFGYIDVYRKYDTGLKKDSIDQFFYFELDSEKVDSRVKLKFHFKFDSNFQYNYI